VYALKLESLYVSPDIVLTAFMLPCSAHQWFGNLVTMKWWNEFWLNEGFATFLEKHALDHLFPEWDMWAQFTAGQGASAKALDAVDSTPPMHPDVADVQSIDDIWDQFSDISFDKGCSVVRMLTQLLGETVTFAGLTTYLTVRLSWWSQSCL
jgi:aminopeptidase N